MSPATKQKHIKDLVTRVASHVLKEGGVVRRLDSWGTRTLPQRMRRNKQYYQIGECVFMHTSSAATKIYDHGSACCSYWTMQFDASPTTLRSLNTIMRHDPRVIRWTNLKVGEKVTDVLAMPEKTIDRV